MLALSAHELKQGGLTVIKKMLKATEDIVVQERGKDACVIIDLKHYDQLRLCELEVAYLRAQEDIKNGKFEVVKHVDAHINKVINNIKREESTKKKSPKK